MRAPSRTSSIKTAQKEKEIFRVVATLLREVGREAPALATLFLNRVQLSTGKGMCYLYVYTPLGKEAFEQMRPELVLYKPSIRKAMADSLDARYTAEIIFVFDEQFERTARIESLLEQIKTENGGSSDTSSVE
jgi:ribosome-binding factor A